MSSITDRYATAVHSSNLASDPDTTRSDSDVLGAMGFAGKPWLTDPGGHVRRRGSPLGAALLRLFMGDNHASSTIVEILAAKADGKAHRTGVDITRLEAEDLARKVLAWHRDGICRPCGGHGVQIIPGTTTLSGANCTHCGGSGRLRLDRHIVLQHLDLAQWLLAEMDREMGVAGPLAMRALAPRLDL